MPRDEAGSIELREGTGPIVSMCPCDGFLEIYKQDTTFRFQTPEDIDPERTNPNAPFAAAVTDSVGSANPIIARVLLQGREIVQTALFVDPVDKQAVILTLHQIKEALVACYKASIAVESGVENVIKQLGANGLQSAGRGRVLPSVPQVADLENHTTQFLISAKRTIKSICDLVPLFVQLDRSDSNFDHLGNRLARILGEVDPLTIFVREYANVSRYLIELRNSQEHPRPEKTTRIENFRIQADGSLREPVWYVTGESPRSIHLEMPAAVDRLIEMAEWALIHLVDYRLDSKWPWVLEHVPDAQIDSSCPIRYRLTMDTAELNLPRK